MAPQPATSELRFRGSVNRGSRSERASLLLAESEPAHWFSPGGLRDPAGQVHGISVDDLHEAALRGDIQLVHKFVEAEAPVNAPLRVAGGDEYLTLLHVISARPTLPNGPGIAYELIYGKANPNARSTLGSTPLMFACFHKNVALAEVLLETGADPDAVDDHGKTALRYAVSLQKGEPDEEERSAQLIEVLEEHGGDLDKGGTLPPIAEAVLQDNGTAVTQLLELGAASDGLVHAVPDKPLKVIKELIRGGANPFAQNPDGQTCMELAEDRGDKAVIDCLQHYIAELERCRSRHLKSKLFSYDSQWPSARAREHSQWLASGHSKQSVEALEEDIVLSLDLPSPEQKRAALLRFQVKLLLGNPVFQAVLTTNLVLALFLPDFWVILAMQGRTALDVALVMIFLTFVIEFIAHVISFPYSYPGSYTFWTDVISMLSVPLDFSVVADNFVGLFEGSGLARITKFAKLSARAVRLSRLAKLLRFLPGSRTQRELERSRQGPAKEISLELMADLSIKVAMLIIALVLILPLIDFFKYPPDDNSMATWTSQLYWTSKTHPEDAMAVIEDMKQFYSALEYYPFQVMYFINGTQISYVLESATAPMREDDIVTLEKEDASIKFNFRTPILAEAVLNVVLMFVVILVIFVASGGVASAVTYTVLSPVEDLLEIVHSTAVKIFDSVEQMAIYFVKDYSNQQNVEIEAEDVSKNRFSHEVRLLAKVLKKLDLLTLIANAKRPVDEFEQLGDGPCAFLPDYATYAAARHQRTLPRSEAEAEREEDELPMLMESIGLELGPAEISRRDFFSWELNIAELNARQRTALARCLVTMFDTSPGFEDRQVVSLTRYTCHCDFIKALEHQFEDEEVVPFHNWIHAVDVAFSLHVVFHVASASNFLALHERHALMLAALAHDVGHFGVNNGFLRDSSHELALLYNDQSCLQNMSCAKLFRLASEPDTPLFSNFDEPTRRDVRQVIVSAILHSDPACHMSLMAHMLRHYGIRQDLFEYIHQLLREDKEENAEVLAKAKTEVEEYFWNADVKYTLRNFLLNFVDNSHSLKPWEICSTWAARLFEEFFKQGDTERSCKMPMQPLNDRVRVNVPFAQVTYIKHLVAPQAILLVKMLPAMRECTVSLWSNLQRWASKWERSGPDHDEMQRVRKEIRELHEEADEEEVEVVPVKTEISEAASDQRRGGISE
ncbi:dnc [Symbiodinium natans]|uniref:Phosphodiesterase n=1 Tax=Symbiodinium natans TaxID=878477 RepID=A0A812UZ96_9DINO|nr:dnc [Symbiodinium natans]